MNFKEYFIMHPLKPAQGIWEIFIVSCFCLFAIILIESYFPLIASIADKFTPWYYGCFGYLILVVQWIRIIDVWGRIFFALPKKKVLADVDMSWRDQK